MGNATLRALGALIFTAIAVAVCQYLIETGKLSAVREFARYVLVVYAALAGTVVHVALKLGDIPDMAALRFDDQRRLEPIVKRRIREIWALFFFYLLGMIAALVTTLMPSDEKTVAYLVCVPFALAIFFALHIPGWFRELSSLKWKVQQKEKLRRATEDMLNKMHEESKNGFRRDRHLDGYNKPCL